MSNLLKSGWFVVREDEARVIKSNEKLEAKLKELRIIEEKEEESEDLYEPEEFAEGLESEQVDALLSEDGGENYLEKAEDTANTIDESSIIKAEPINAGPTPEELLEQAQVQSSILLEQAKKEAEDLKKQAYEAGHREGYQAGQEELLQQQQKQEQVLQEKELELERQYKNKTEELEPIFVDLITNIYEHVFHIDLSDFRDIILYSITHVIGASENKKDFIIRVSSIDYPYINERRNQIAELTSANATLEIVEDVTMAQGECVIETGGGIFDCGIDTQLEGLAKELRLLSYEKKD